MNWPKDRKKAFLVAAEAFGTPYENRTERQKTLTLLGICYTIEILTDSDNIYFWVRDFKCGCGIQTLFWWPHRRWHSWTPDCDKQRSLFCSLMAALSHKEFEELAR